MANWPPPPEANRPMGRMPISDDIASKALDAYKSNPMLTALFVMNLVTFLGFGWYLLDKEGKTAKYVLQMQADMKDVRIEAMRTAAECNHNKLQHTLPLIQIPPKRAK